jgi:hypothetical protein
MFLEVKTISILEQENFYPADVISLSLQSQ